MMDVARKGNRDRDRFERDFDRETIDANFRRRKNDDDDDDRRGRRFLKLKKQHNHPWWENDDRDNRRGRRGIVISPSGSSDRSSPPVGLVRGFHLA
jgi:hypothetical protein